MREVLEHQQVNADVSPVERWHPVEETWQDASIPLPQTDEEIAAERARQEVDEARDSREQGYAEWQVRVDLPTHRDAVELAERLEDEGISPLVRRWKYILIGTETDQQAGALAERIRAEAPPGAEVKAEPSAAIGWELTSGNWFNTFGGFGPGPRYGALTCHGASLEARHGWAGKGIELCAGRDAELSQKRRETSRSQAKARRVAHSPPRFCTCHA